MIKCLIIAGTILALTNFIWHIMVRASIKLVILCFAEKIEQDNPDIYQEDALYPCPRCKATNAIVSFTAKRKWKEYPQVLCRECNHQKSYWLWFVGGWLNKRNKEK